MDVSRLDKKEGHRHESGEFLEGARCKIAYVHARWWPNHSFISVCVREERFDGEDKEAAGDEATSQDKGQSICKKGDEESRSQEAGKEAGLRQGESRP